MSSAPHSGSTTTIKTTSVETSVPNSSSSLSSTTSAPLSSTSTTTTTASSLGTQISNSAASALESVKSSLEKFDNQHQISSQFHDVASSASASIKQGHPLSAITNAPTAARIGQAERAKHQAGPLPENAHVATGTEPKEPSALHSNTMSDKMSDVSSHMKSAISHGHPIHAVSNAGTAAMIGQVEREKHLKGPLPEDAAATGMSAPAGSTTISTSTTSVPAAVTGI